METSSTEVVVSITPMIDATLDAWERALLRLGEDPVYARNMRLAANKAIADEIERLRALVLSTCDAWADAAAMPCDEAIDRVRSAV